MHILLITSAFALCFFAGFEVLVAVNLQHGFQSLRSAGQLKPGSIIREFALVDLRSRRRFVLNSARSEALLLLFLASDSMPSRILARTLRTAGRIDDTSVVVLCSGPERDCEHVTAAFPNEWILGYDSNAQIARMYGVAAFPTALFFEQGLSLFDYICPLTKRSLVRSLREIRCNRIGQSKLG